MRSPLVPLGLFRHAQPRDGERVGVLWAGGHVRVVLPLRALPAARARLQPARGRPRVPAVDADLGRVLARPLGEARDAVRDQAAARRRAAARRARACCCSRGRRSTGATSSTSCRACSCSGFGAGIAFNPLLLAAMGDVEPEESGLASGIVNTAFMMGGALGLAVLASLAAVAHRHLAASGDERARRAERRLPPGVPARRAARRPRGCAGSGAAASVRSPCAWRRACRSSGGRRSGLTDDSGSPGTASPPREGSRRRSLPRAARRAHARARGAPLAGALQPRVSPGIRRDAAPVPPHAPSGAGRGAPAHDRPQRSPTSASRSACGASARSRRASAGRSGVADDVPRVAPAGRRHAPSSRRACCAPGPPAVQQFSRRQPGAAWLAWPPTVQRQRRITMLQLSHASVWVHDQDEALAFYTDKLGMEIRDDVTVPELGNFRWLTVGPAGTARRRDHADGRARPARVRCGHARAAQGARGQGRRRRGLLRGPTTARATTRSSRAAASSSSRSRRSSPYGLDAGFRDPSGNEFRMVQTS